MYWFDILDILKKKEGEFLSTVEIVQMLKNKREVSPQGVVKILRKMSLKLDEVHVKRENFRLCYYKYSK